ncbi:MAG TPA: phosphopantetheine-binding protein [Chitinophagaceae bacterium]|nr:phosphopantetheine-binding protein [Chitinophagaceae bacterium]
MPVYFSKLISAMQDLKYELKKQIIQELNLQDIKPEDIIDDAPLFGDGLGLDSIDALELVVLMEKYHGVKILDETVGKKVLASINTMADYILEENSKSK